MYLGDAKHVIKHSWWLHILGVALTISLVDSKSHRAKNRIRKVQVELTDEHEIYRPGSKLVGIEGTRETYHFIGGEYSEERRGNQNGRTPRCRAGAQKGEGGAVVA